MKNLALEHVKNLKPYHPPTSGRTIYRGLRLDFNERTGDPEFLKELLEDFKNKNLLHVYPEYGEAESAIAGYCNVKTNQVIVCDGSDQGIETIFRTYTKNGDQVVIPEPTFSMFAQCANVCANEIYSPDYDENMNYPVESVLQNVNGQTKLVVIVTPNNPTGTSVSLSEVEKIAEKASNAIIVVDEAYFEFSNVTALKLLDKFSNIVILRTFSKAFGLAGLRIGYVLSSEENIAEMKKVQSPYGVNSIAAAAAVKALENISEMQSYVNEVNEISRPFLENFFEEIGVKYYKSDANLVLFEVDNNQVVYQKLKEKGFLTRPQSKPLISNTIRVTITNIREMRAFSETYRRLFR